MPVGLLEAEGTIEVKQFWPEGRSDADTSKVVVTIAPDGPPTPVMRSTISGPTASTRRRQGILRSSSRAARQSSFSRKGWCSGMRREVWLGPTERLLASFAESGPPHEVSAQHAPASGELDRVFPCYPRAKTMVAKMQRPTVPGRRPSAPSARQRPRPVSAGRPSRAASRP